MTKNSSVQSSDTSLAKSSDQSSDQATSQSTSQALIRSLGEMSNFDQIINMKRYPIKDLSTPAAQELLAKCRKSIRELGACEMPEFVIGKALELLQAESAVLEKNAFYKPVVGNAYLTPLDDKLPKDHPRNMTDTTNVGVIAYDQFPDLSLLRRIYEWDPLMRFIGAIMDLPEIHRYGDPMGGLNLAVMRTGDYLRWHFDQTDFVTSLAVQSSTEGGEFEYAPLIRSESAENYENVKKILEGDRSLVTRITNSPGTLVLFKGRYSIHRVTRIGGNTTRWMGLFGFDSKPNVCSSPHLLDLRYGRQKAISNRPTF